MIPKSHILEWAAKAPWQQLYQIKQDLIITSTLIKLYNHPFLKESLAFRGGTALNKLFFKEPTRYSEDIDLVQITAQPIGPTISTIRELLDPWFGHPKRSASNGLMTLEYRIKSEEEFLLKLKVEINTREHFSVMGYHEQHLSRLR